MMHQCSDVFSIYKSTLKLGIQHAFNFSVFVAQIYSVFILYMNYYSHLLGESRKIANWHKLEKAAKTISTYVSNDVPFGQ